MDARCRKRLAERAVLLDVGRLVARALARVAYAGAMANGRVRVDELTTECIDRSIDELVEQDRSDEQEKRSMGPEKDPRYEYFAEALGVEPMKARRACVVFNDLPHDVRRAYWTVVIEGVSIHECASAGMGSRSEIEGRLRRALLAISLLDDPGTGEPSEGEQL